MVVVEEVVVVEVVVRGVVVEELWRRWLSDEL